MLDLFLLAAAFVVPLAVACGGLYGWGRVTRRPLVGQWLRTSATAWFCGLFLTTMLLVVTAATCKGNALYGYHGCSAFPDQVATGNVGLFALGYLAGIGYGVILVLVCGIVEWRHRQT